MRVSLLATAAFLVLVPSAATAQPPPKPAFSSSVDIVSVDVNVVDQQGRPVQDLGRNDFNLTVDGRERKIASAQFVSLVQGAAPTPAAASGPLPEFSTNAAQQVRHVGVVVDRGSIAPGRARDVLDAAARFVEKLNPADRVALFTIPTGPSFDFTTDHRSIVAALRQIDGQGDFQRGTLGIGISDALAFEKNNTIAIDNVNDRMCGTVGARGGGGSDVAICRRMVSEEANIVANYAHDRARNTINGLRAILERLGSSDTPKTLLLVSEAMVIDGERRLLEGFSHAAAAAHVTVYALEPEPSDSDASQARAPMTRSRDRAAREEGLQFVTSVGGGELFRVVADPDFAFARVASELSGYYLLGFEPEAGDRDGRSHTISVKVNRDHVSVRSRREFGVGLTRGKNAQQAIADLLRSPIVTSELPLTVTTYSFQDPGSLRVRLLVAMDIERSPDQNGRTSVGMVLLDEKGTVAASLFQPEIPANIPSPLGSERYFATLLTEPGPYTLRVAIADDVGRRGSIERSVRAYMRRVGQFRATDLLIGDNTVGKEGAAIVPTVTGLTSAAALHSYMELVSDAPAAFANTSVDFEVAATPDGPALQRVSSKLAAPDADEHSRAASASVALTPLAAGAYVLRAVISVDGQKVGQISRSFRVIRTSGA